MTHEALVAFLQQVARDPALQEKFSEFAAKEGFVFDSSELNDADLDRIAGGIGGGTTWNQERVKYDY